MPLPLAPSSSFQYPHVLCNCVLFVFPAGRPAIRCGWIRGRTDAERRRCAANRTLHGAAHATQLRVQGVHGKEELIRYLAMGRWDGDGADARVTVPRAPNV